MKILWCHEVSYSRKPIYEYQDFAERLSGRGHEVEVIDFDESMPSGPGSEILNRTGEGSVIRSSIPHGNVPFLKFAMARLRFSRMLKERLENGDIDVIFVYSVFINGTEAVRLGKRFGVPVVYRAIDAYHRLRPGLLAKTLLRLGEKYIYRNADKVLVTNELMRDYVAALSGTEAGPRLRVLDHGVDTGHFRPLPKDAELCRVLGIAKDDPVILFLGTTYAFSGLAKLVERMPELLAAYPGLKLLVMGAGEQDAELRRLVDDLSLQGCVILTGMIAYSELPSYLSVADFALNPFEINEITRDIIPIKMLQYQASGLPVVSTPLPDLMKKHPAGLSGITYSKSDQIEDFAVALRDTMESENAKQQGARGLDFVKERYSVSSAIDSLERELESLVEAAR